MRNSIKYKVPGGKLLIVKAEWKDRITNLELLGDFFVHPEEGLHCIEMLLVGSEVDEDEAWFSGTVQQFVDQNSITLIGINPEAIAKAVVMVMGL